MSFLDETRKKSISHALTHSLKEFVNNSVEVFELMVSESLSKRNQIEGKAYFHLARTPYLGGEGAGTIDAGLLLCGMFYSSLKTRVCYCHVESGTLLYSKALDSRVGLG